MIDIARIAGDQVFNVIIGACEPLIELIDDGGFRLAHWALGQLFIGDPQQAHHAHRTEGSKGALRLCEVPAHVGPQMFLQSTVRGGTPELDRKSVV